MVLGSGLFLIVVGAILAFAVKDSVEAVDLTMVGYIMLAAGVIAIIVSLIVNAQNDPFLSDSCYPTEITKENPQVRFEAPTHGGHVGFAQFNKNGLYWSEERALAFLQSLT